MSVLEKFIDRIFKLNDHQTTIRREITAGAASFLTVAHVIILVPLILSETGMNPQAVMSATILTAAYSCLLMGVLANYPFILGPGVTLSAYFAYFLVLTHGTPWRTGLGIIFICGIILLFLNLLRIRQLIIREIPFSIRVATTAGLGLFLALVGLKKAGIIQEHTTFFLSFGDFNTVNQLMAAVGIIVIGILLVFRIPGAVFLGMIFLWLISLLFGFTQWQGLVSWPKSLLPGLFQLDVQSVFNPNHLSILISFLFVALFDSTGILVGLAEDGGFLKEEEKQRKCILPGVSRSLIPDTTGTILAPMLGTTAVAVYMESAAGIGIGGRTGLTAFTAGILFLVALFFTPLAASIPLFATAPVLIIIGGSLLKFIKDLDWKDATEWIPGFLTLILIPLTYSVANGIAIGYISHCMLKLLTWKVKEVHWLTWTLAVFFILKLVFLPHL